MGELEGLAPLGLPDQVQGLDAFEAAFARLLDRVETEPGMRERVQILGKGNPVAARAVIDPVRWTRKMIDGATARAGEWLENTSATVDAMKAAALEAGKAYAEGVTAAVRDNSYSKGVQGIDTAEVRATLTKVGASGYSSGISNREGKIGQAVAKLQPKVAALKQTINAMPKETDGQREERLRAARKGMIAIGKT